jgi:uncharacterized membrane protein
MFVTGWSVCYLLLGVGPLHFLFRSPLVSSVTSFSRGLFASWLSFVAILGAPLVCWVSLSSRLEFVVVLYVVLVLRSLY